MRRLYLLRVWLYVMLFLVFVFELCSQISIWGTLARLLTVKLEEHFLASSLIKFTLLSTAFIIKILIEHVGGFSHRSSTSYIILVKLYNLFEHNTDYLMSCPTGLLCMPSSTSNSTWGSNATRATSLAIHVLRGEVCWSLDPALCARNATLWRHYMDLVNPDIHTADEYIACNNCLLLHTLVHVVAVWTHAPVTSGI